jgi:hypothetical protein
MITEAFSSINIKLKNKGENKVMIEFDVNLQKAWQNIQAPNTLTPTKKKKEKEKEMSAGQSF